MSETRAECLRGKGLTKVFGSGNKKTVAVDHVDFDFREGEIISIVGESGSGKTTFCNLIARFWDTDSGSVKIGGYDVKDYTLASLMDQISVVFQTVYLFADTIENNIKFGRPNATHDEVVAAAMTSSKACQRGIKL